MMNVSMKLIKPIFVPLLAFNTRVLFHAVVSLVFMSSMAHTKIFSSILLGFCLFVHFCGQIDVGVYVRTPGVRIINIPLWTNELSIFHTSLVTPNRNNGVCFEKYDKKEEV